MSFRHITRLASRSNTVAEVTDELRERLDEVDRASSLDVLSSVEATFRIDYLQRCQRRLKDPISVSLRKIYRFKKNRASLEDEIFDAWIQNSPGLTRLFSELRGAFKYRHWLAHGRYWTPKLGRRFDFPYIYELAEATFTNLQFEL